MGMGIAKCGVALKVGRRDAIERASSLNEPRLRTPSDSVDGEPTYVRFPAFRAQTAWIRYQSASVYCGFRDAAGGFDGSSSQTPPEATSE